MKKRKKQNEQKPISREQFHMENQKLIEHIESLNFDNVDDINEYLQKNLLGKRIDEVIPAKKGRKSNAEKSDELVYQAYECENEIEKISLINEALKLNPENVRAINLKADCSRDINKAKGLYKQAMEIGKKQLGEGFFEENKGHFWGIHSTRPYMTAKLNYANILQAIEGKELEAIKELEELLELNPNDNQGVRYYLSIMYLKKRKYQDYLKLHRSYDEDSTFWNYNYLIYLLATEGITSKAKKAFTRAVKTNKHVVEIFVGERKVEDAANIHYYGPGDADEAQVYVNDSIDLWAGNKIVMKNFVKILERLS